MASVTQAEELLITVEIAGYALEGRRCEIDEGLSVPERVMVEIANATDVDFAPLMEGDATIVLTVGGVIARRFVRKLASATFLTAEDGHLHYALEFRPSYWFLDHAMNTRKFRDKTTEAIVDQVLGEEGVAHTWKTQRRSQSRPYCVQYRETTKAFIDRLFEYEGFYYSFDEAGTLVIADTSSGEPMVEGLAVYPLLEGAGALESNETGIHRLTRGARVSSGHATVNDHNFKIPTTSLLQTSAAGIDSDLEVYDYPTGYRDAGVGAILAKLRLEALVAEKRFVEGSSNVPQFRVARIVNVSHHEAIDFSGRYLLVRVSHVFQRQIFGTERKAEAAAGYENRFFAIPSSVPWRPPLITPHPVIQGNHTATVRGPAGEEIHTDVHGRAKVQFHWDREAKGTDEDSRWIRTLQETSSSMVLSRVGWEIVVGYIDGDPDRPVGLGRNINGKMTPTYGQPDRKNIMTIKTESYPTKNGFNELRLDDSAGSMRMDIHAQRDHFNTVENDKTEKITNNHFHLVKAGLDRAVGKNQTLRVGGNEARDVQASYTETVRLNRTETIGGSEKVDVKVTSTTSVAKNETIKIGSVRFTLAGLGSVSLPSPKDIVGVIVPHVLGADSDNMLTGGTDDGGANDGRQAANLETGGKVGPNTAAYGGEGTFAGFGSTPGGPSGPNGGGAPSSGGGIGGLIGELSGGGQGLISKGLDSIIGQVAGSGPLGSGLQGVASGLTSGQGLQSALGQGAQGALSNAAGSVGGPLGTVLGGLTSGKGALGGIGTAIASGNLSGIGAAVSTTAKGIGQNLKQMVSAEGLKSIGTELLESMFKGSINRETRKTLLRMIGAAQITGAGGSIMIGANYLFTELVGGLKLSMAAKGAVMQAPGKFLVHTVGGMILRKSKEDMSLGANKSTVRVGAKAKIHSDEKVELRSKVIEIEGQQKVTLKSGDLLIELAPKSTTIKGTLKATSGTSIKVTGKPDKLTA